MPLTKMEKNQCSIYISCTCLVIISTSMVLAIQQGNLFSNHLAILNVYASWSNNLITYMQPATTLYCNLNTKFVQNLADYTTVYLFLSNTFALNIIWPTNIFYHEIYFYTIFSPIAILGNQNSDNISLLSEEENDTTQQCYYYFISTSVSNY